MKTKLLCASLSIFGFLVILSACSKESKTPDMQPEGEKMTMETFKQVGEMHNLFLEEASKNFLIPAEPISREEKIEMLKDFQIEMVNSLDISDAEKEIITSGLEKYKEMYDSPIVAEKLYAPATRSDGNYEEMNIYQA